jgi:dephospho-CoA kinase
MPIIGLTGMAGAGKSSVGRYIAAKYKHTYISFSEILAAEAERRDLLRGLAGEARKLVLSNFGDTWRQETGKNEVIAEKIIEMIRTDKLSKVVVDGFRSPAEVHLFRQEFPEFKLIHVYTPTAVRLQRLQSQDHTLTQEAFNARDKNDTVNKGLGDVVRIADIELNNSSDFKSMFMQVDSLMKRLGI